MNKNARHIFVRGRLLIRDWNRVRNHRRRRWIRSAAMRQCQEIPRMWQRRGTQSGFFRPHGGWREQALCQFAPLCPAGHLPHTGGDRMGAIGGILPKRHHRDANRPRCKSARRQTGRPAVLLIPHVGQMPGKAEGGKPGTPKVNSEARPPKKLSRACPCRHARWRAGRRSASACLFPRNARRSSRCRCQSLAPWRRRGGWSRPRRRRPACHRRARWR